MTTYQCPWRFIFPGVNGDIFRNQDNNEWYKAGVKLVEDNFKLKPNTNTAKSAILFLGDGMGITTITATRILDGQQKGNTGEENVLSWEVFPWSALAKTYTVDQQGTDSASSATAFLSGIKTDNGKFKPFPYLPNSYWRPNISRPLKPWKCRFCWNCYLSQDCCNAFALHHLINARWSQHQETTQTRSFMTRGSNFLVSMLGRFHRPPYFILFYFFLPLLSLLSVLILVSVKIPWLKKLKELKPRGLWS